MVARPGFLKSIKEWGKKIADKAGGFIDKTTKFLRKYQPVVDKITDFIPGGDKIDEYLDKGLKIAEKTGEGLRDIGKGKNVIKTIANKTGEYLMDKSSSNDPTNNNKQKAIKKPPKTFSFLDNKLN